MSLGGENKSTRVAAAGCVDKGTSRMSDVSVDQLIAEAKRHLDAAEERQRTADEEKWAAAELLWKANRDHGVSKRELARRVGRSVQTIGRHIAVWETRCVTERSDQSFTEAYYEVRGPSDNRQGIADREARRVVTDRPEVIAEAITKADPDVQRKIADAIVRAEPEPSLRQVVSAPKPAPKPAKGIDQRLEAATFSLWEVGELLMDEVPSGEERVRMISAAEKAERLARGIALLLNTVCAPLKITAAEFEAAIGRARDIAVERGIWLTPIYERDGWWTGYPTDRIIALASIESGKRNIAEAERNRRVASARAKAIGSTPSGKIAEGLALVELAYKGGKSNLIEQLPESAIGEYADYVVERVDAAVDAGKGFVPLDIPLQAAA